MKYPIRAQYKKLKDLNNLTQSKIKRAQLNLNLSDKSKNFKAKILINIKLINKQK